MELVNIKIGTSLFYYIYLLSCFGVFFGLYFGLRKKSEKVQKWVLFGILALNFALHFIKQAFPEYLFEDYYVTGTLVRKGFPAILRKCTPENICAVSTLIFPFIFLSKWKTGKDYMFYLGSISGLLGCFVPLPAKGLPFYSPEVIRCFICHASLWQVPILMVLFGHHKLDYRRIWKTLVMYFLVLCVIMVNELILIRIGWVGTKTLFTEVIDGVEYNGYFDSSSRDMGYAVGLPAGTMDTIGKYVLWMTPRAWKDPYVPILWELFPVIIYGGLGCLAMCAYWEHKHMRQDCVLIINKCKSVIQKLKAKKATAAGAEKAQSAGSAQDAESTVNTESEDNSQNQDDKE